MVANDQQVRCDLTQLISSICPDMLEGDLADRVSEIRHVASENSLNDEEMQWLNKFAFVLELLGHGHVLIEPARKELDRVMQALCRCVDLEWRMIKKRSRFQTALYYLFFRHIQSCIPPKLKDVAALVELMPEFRPKSEAEQIKLLAFANGVALMSDFLPPESNKIIYMDVVSWLASDARRRWVPGGRQTPETSDRVDIFCQLTGVVPVIKKPRSMHARRVLESAEKRKGAQTQASPIDGCGGSSSSSELTRASNSPLSNAGSSERKTSECPHVSFGGQTTRKGVMPEEKRDKTPAKRRHSPNGVFVVQP